MEKLKMLRKEKKLNQIDVANFLDITVSAYGNYELGQRSPTPETLIKLADFFNVSIDYLLNHETKKTPPQGSVLTKNKQYWLELFDILGHKNIELVCDILKPIFPQHSILLENITK